jgi:arginase family enzyme
LYVGLKDLDQTEIDFIKKENLSAVAIPDFINGGFVELGKKIIELQKKVKYIWVSMDMDSIDKEYSPASPMATKGGFTYREIVYIAKTIGRLPNVIGMDLVEWAPKNDKENATANLALELIAAIFGSEHSFYTEYIQKHHK